MLVYECGGIEHVGMVYIILCRSLKGSLVTFYDSGAFLRVLFGPSIACAKEDLLLLLVSFGSITEE